MHIFLLKLRVLFNFTLGYIDQCSGVTKILLKKSLELSLKQSFYLTLTFLLVLMETNPSTKKKSD